MLSFKELTTQDINESQHELSHNKIQMLFHEMSRIKFYEDEPHNTTLGEFKQTTQKFHRIFENLLFDKG